MWFLAQLYATLAAATSGSADPLVPAAAISGSDQPSPLAKYSGPKLFNVGLPRTGTTSLASCLSELGLRSMHANQGEIETIYPEAYEGFRSGTNTTAVDALVDANDSFGDLPWFSLAPSLMRKYAPSGAAPRTDGEYSLPKVDASAIFVATKRPVDDWVPSFRLHVMRFVHKEPESPHGADYFAATFGSDIFTPGCLLGSCPDHWNLTLKSDENARLDSLLRQAYHRHYEQLHAAADDAGVTLHILDLADAKSIPAQLQELIGEGLADAFAFAAPTCQAYQAMASALSVGDPEVLLHVD